MNNISCPICNSNVFKIIYRSTLTPKDLKYENLVSNMKNTLDDYTKHAQIVKCNNCSLVYTNPMEDLSMVLRAYSDVVDEEYLNTEKYRKILLKKHLQSFKKYKRGGKILDIGSFAGYFLEIAKENKWDPYGIEPSSWASKIAKKKDIKHIGRDILSTKIKQNYFDAITMWDVIEHLPEPHKVINKINGALKKGGILAIGTPNIDSLFAKVLGKRCPFLIRMHIILYSPKTLQLLLKNHGFKILSISYYGRTFPISYLIDRIHVKNHLAKKILIFFKKIPVISNLTITLNFRDSFRIIAQKN